MMTYSEPEIIFYPQVTSTNTQMKNVIASKHLAEYSVVITADQTSGKGQIGNTWESEKNANLTFSLLLRPTFLKPHLQFYISKIISLGIIDTIQPLTQEKVSIKWPNDIYIGNKKLAGILIENSILGAQLDYCIVGIGINVNQVIFTSDAPNPISLIHLNQEKYDLENILEQTLERIQLRYEQLQKKDLSVINTNYMAHLFRNEGYYCYEDEHGKFDARIDSISELGMLTLIDQANKKRQYAFKEVSFCL